ncbi:hypothetical protein FOA52_000449 [Chlamydomonas sp. UWO 241]|nr:hypothetical protein FOA52_000449 [Chlamydomonas sp. UWO 241]
MLEGAGAGVGTGGHNMARPGGTGLLAWGQAAVVVPIMADDLSGVKFASELHPHILNQISDAGYYLKVRSGEAPAFGHGMAEGPGKHALHVCVSVTDFTSIDCVSETFEVKLRMYAMWEPALEQLPTHLVQRAAASSAEYISLDAGEIAEVEAAWGAPLSTMLSVFNSIDCERDEQGLRLYGGTPGRTALLWNQEYKIKCRERFELHNFPFDVQDLSLELRLNDPSHCCRLWHAGHGTGSTSASWVQLHNEALSLTEWDVLPPNVCRKPPLTRVSRVRLRVRRRSHYYVVNVVGIMFALSLLGLLSFSMPVDDIGNRVQTC